LGVARLFTANPGNFVTQRSQLRRVPSQIDSINYWNFYVWRLPPAGASRVMFASRALMHIKVDGASPSNFQPELRKEGGSPCRKMSPSPLP
jgi:hypothetical protein